MILAALLDEEGKPRGKYRDFDQLRDVISQEGGRLLLAGEEHEGLAQLRVDRFGNGFMNEQQMVDAQSVNLALKPCKQPRFRRL